MTQTSPTETQLNPVASIQPGDVLLHLIVLLLAPLFLEAGGGDVNFARLAALETVGAYRARNNADLIAIAQIIAYGLASLGSLGLSMADDLSLSMILRLRGNANALNRSAEQNRRALRQPLREPDNLPQVGTPEAEPAGAGPFNPDQQAEQLTTITTVPATNGQRSAATRHDTRRNPDDDRDSDNRHFSKDRT